MDGMNSVANESGIPGHFLGGPNGYHEQPDPRILQALELIHDPRSSNDHRQEASRYLEDVKSQDNAPYNGYLYASNTGHAPIIRHFGLSLLENAIRHHWTNYTLDESIMIRDWVVKLASGIEKRDPLFVRNKIAQLWVEVAKRSWALDWMNMDELLVELWGGSAVRKVLVLEVLETLSENSFGKEDTTTALRGQDLNKACVEIFTPAQVMTEHFPERDTNINVRYGDEGWTLRITDFLGWCNEQDRNDRDVQSCTIKALSTLKSIVPWTILAAIAAARFVQRVCQTLMSMNCTMQLAAIETMYALYSRSNLSDEDVRILVGPLYERETVDVFKKLYEWSLVQAGQIDDEKYLLCKKFSEMIHNVGKFLQERTEALPEHMDISGFLDLLLAILQNESLHVSIPVLHLWVQLLQSREVGNTPPIIDRIGPLLETCSQRLIRYELLPEGSNVPALLFLSEDLDTVPERHAFLGNYARFCRDVVDCIVQKRPYEALNHILSQADRVIQHMHDGEPAFDVHSYKKTSTPALKLDAQVSVIEAALAGYNRWRVLEKPQKDNDDTNDKQRLINSNLERWCAQLLDVTDEDPTIQQRILGLVVEFAINPLKRNAPFVITVFQYVLDTKARLLTRPVVPKASHYKDAIKEFQRHCSHQMQRIAFRTADFLMEAFVNIDSSVRKYCQMPQAEDEDRDRCIAVLFIIVQRASKISDEERNKRLESYVEYPMSKWQSAELSTSLQSFEGFCNLLGLSGFQDYYIKRNASQISDWSQCPLDEEGLAIKARIEAAQHDLPLRATKNFFTVSLDKSEPGSRAHDAALVLWSKHLPIILNNVLQMISLSHIFSEPSTWDILPTESRSIPARILKDRFWQVGISTGSRDDFYAHVEQSKTSLEGLASAIRGCLRSVRDTCYRLVSLTSFLGETIYRFEGLSGPLSKAVFEHSNALTTHQTGVILEMMRPIIEHCPPSARGHFLTPLLTAMFDSLDRKVRAEWNIIDQRNKAANEDDDLVEEMKNESILRQLTFNCVTIVVRLLDPGDPITAMIQSKMHTARTTLRDFVLGTPEVFKSVILFCTHALQMHDSRACALITRVLRSIVGAFTGTDPVEADIREFISTEVFKAAITSLHDPYFVDTQTDLAHLIASIIKRYTTLTDTPRQLLLSLPGLNQQLVDSALHKILKADGNSKQQRAVVLKLLEGLRGVSISEQGKFPRPASKKTRTAMQEKYATPHHGHDNTNRERSPDLGGVADMFA